MGNIHSPKTIYKDGLVMEFYVKKNQVFYKLSKWVDAGSNLSLIESKKLGNQNPDDVIKEAQLMFTGVMQ